MSEELKACPFCGGNAVLVTKFSHLAYFVECERETCTALLQADTEAEVIEMWNRRQTEDDLRARIIELEADVQHDREQALSAIQQLGPVGDMVKSIKAENKQLRAEVTRLEGINETALHLLTQYGDKADEYEAAHRAQAAKIAELAAYVGAGKAAEGIDSEIPY
jgi:Lar family restriction alleviation protein